MPRHLPANYLVAKIQPQECVVKSLGVIFQPTLFAKAFFKNIKASDGIDEGVFEKLLNTQYSVVFLLSLATNQASRFATEGLHTDKRKLNRFRQKEPIYINTTT